MRYPSTGTDSVSRYSNVAGTSRIDFTPAHTTSTGVLPSTPRSAETSKVSPAPRCTPPSPPVANTSIPARCARADGRGHRRGPAATGRHGHPEVAHRELDEVVGRAQPVQLGRVQADPAPRPSNTAMVAGTAPAARTAALDLVGDPPVVAARQAVRQDGRLQGDHRADPAASACGHLGVTATSSRARSVIGLDSSGSVVRWHHDGQSRCPDIGSGPRRAERPSGDHCDHVDRGTRARTTDTGTDDTPKMFHYVRKNEDRRVGGDGQPRGGAVR